VPEIDAIKFCLPLVWNLVLEGMVKNIHFAFAKTTMVLLVAISLLLSGFAHRPVLTATQIAQSIYLAEMGLILADLCAEPGEADGEMDMGDCPACHLAASILLPEPVGSFVDVELRTAAAILVPAHTRGFGRTANPATPVRAPPLA
jgi:hypothetical protein